MNLFANNPGNRALFALYTIAFIDLFAVSLFLPLLSKEIKYLGGNSFMVGLIGSAYGAVQLFSSPVMGWCSDEYNQKVVLVTCILASSLAYAIQGYATTLLILMVARCIAGVFKHTQTISKSIVSDIAPSDMSSALGNFNAFGSMGFIIGPTVGAHLVEAEGGFQNVCLLASVGFLINLSILLFFVSTRKSSQKPSKKHTCNFLVPESKDYKYSVLGILFLKLLYSSSTILPRANLPLTLEAKFGTSIVLVGYLNSAQALVSTWAGFTVGPISSKYYKNDSVRMVKVAGVIKMVSLVALVFAPTFNTAALTMLAQSAADPFLRVGITSMSLEGHSDQGTILGLGQTATSASRMIGPFVAGCVQSYSEDGPAIVGSAMAIGGFIFTFFLTRRQYSKLNDTVYHKKWI